MSGAVYQPGDWVHRFLAPTNVVSLEREGYLTSNLGKARARIATACRGAHTLDARLHDVATALTRGDSAVRPAEDVMETIRDLRLLCADLEQFVRLYEAEQPPSPEAA